MMISPIRPKPRSDLADKIASSKILQEVLHKQVELTQEQNRDTQVYRDALKLEVVELMHTRYPRFPKTTWDHEIHEFFRRCLPPINIK